MATVLAQECRHVLLSFYGRAVQRRIAVWVVSAEDQVGIAFEQCLDLFQVATLNRLMKRSRLVLCCKRKCLWRCPL